VSDDLIGRPHQCPECFAWIVPGAEERHVCRPPKVEIRGLLLAMFGARVRARREELGMTQGDAADAVGLTRASIANLESGKQDIGITRVYRLAEALRCTVADLV
jgi:DNA-binding XRE family transcriptional regulator